jgi:hypothetical protein
MARRVQAIEHHMRIDAALLSQARRQPVDHGDRRADRVLRAKLHRSVSGHVTESFVDVEQAADRLCGIT